MPHIFSLTLDFHLHDQNDDEYLECNQVFHIFFVFLGYKDQNQMDLQLQQYLLFYRSKDKSNYEISTLDGITNTSYVVNVDNKKFVLRIPGDNPDVINRISEKHNTSKAQEYGLTLPYLIFDEQTGIKISEFFDIYTYKSYDFQNPKMRNNAFSKLKILHNSDLIFKKNFSPLSVFSDIADISNPIEEESKEVGLKIVKKLNEIGINNNPCHQDLYPGNFVIYKDETFLIDW